MGKLFSSSRRKQLIISTLVIEFGLTIGTLCTAHDLSGLAAVFASINAGVVAYIVGETWRKST